MLSDTRGELKVKYVEDNVLLLVRCCFNQAGVDQVVDDGEETYET